MQHKSNQLNDEESKEQVSIIESEDPALFEELSMRRKWSNVSKDPVKGLKDQQLHKNSYWNMLNHLPSKGVERIVTDKILDMDKVSCDRILKSILEEKQLQDMRKNDLQQHRQDLRKKLGQRHREIQDLEIKSGVRLGMMGGQTTQRRGRTQGGRNHSNGYVPLHM